MPFSLNVHVKLFLLIIGFSFFATCTRDVDRERETDKEKIATVYATKFLNENDEYLYYETKKDIMKLKDFLGSPLTVKKILDVTKPVGDIKLDSLITPQDMAFWNTALKKYSSIIWNEKKLNGLPFIKENEIPDFFREGGIPLQNERIVTIHFLSTPIIHNNVAILYYTVQKSPMIHNSGYYIYAKLKNKWKIVAEDVVVWGG